MQVYIVMGVSGVGKTTIGELLAEKLKLPFFDADDFHPEENVAKMQNSVPLLDEDRKVWLEILSRKINEWHEQGGAILACSALKERYREQLQSLAKEHVTWIFLHSEYDVILKRLTTRKDHYFKPELLQSQYDILEFPKYGVHVDVNKSEKEIIEEIMEKIGADKNSEIGLMGLGVMGKSLALNMASKDIAVAVYNRHVEGLEEDVAKDFAHINREEYVFPWYDDLKAFVASLERPRNIMLMVNAGKAVDAVIESLLPFLEKEDLIIDGGNSHYKDTRRRMDSLNKKGIHFLGIGISGGEEGARKGPSIMPGGSQKAYDRVGPLLEKIAAKDKNGNPCCAFMGPDGAGHFVKMLHNGIEYGEMQLIAETYHFMRLHFKANPEKIAIIFEKWNKELESYLLEISVNILRKKVDDGFLIDKILDAAKQKGTGGWSTNAALELGVPFDTITAAVMSRNMSAKKKERIRAADLYKINQTEGESLEDFEEDLFKGFKAASIINHSNGFDLLQAASEEYHWNLNFSEIARVWTNGCIIRSALMEDLVDIFGKCPDENLLKCPDIVKRVNEHYSSLANVVAKAVEVGFSMPLSSAAVNYFLSYTSEQSPANMIQAQRDYFGAHTYERTDRERGEFFHTQWE